jgi:hypothetical protein
MTTGMRYSKTSDLELMREQFTSYQKKNLLVRDGGLPQLVSMRYKSHFSLYHLSREILITCGSGDIFSSSVSKLLQQPIVVKPLHPMPTSNRIGMGDL